MSISTYIYVVKFSAVHIVTPLYLLNGVYLNSCSEHCLVNLREKFSPGPGFEPGSPALSIGALLTAPSR